MVPLKLMRIFVVNIGSESKKYALYEGEHELWSVHIENRQDVLEDSKLAGAFDVIAFRIVAPGDFFRKDRVIDADYMAQLQSARMKAPMHINLTMAEIVSFQERFPGMRLVGISDSAFHRTIPDHARYYALPAVDTTALEIERFGYHGISLSSIMEVLKTQGPIPARIIVCHLGGGSSITAIKDGKSIDTTMGMTPLSGLPMATRIGDIDPGALAYLAAMKDLRGEKLEEYLANQCGFFGVAGTNDMRELLARESIDEHAALALNMFVYQIQKYIGAYAAILGGLDALIFSGTIGERSDPVKSKILAGLDLRGAHSLTVPTDEMTEMARLASSIV